MMLLALPVLVSVALITRLELKSDMAELLPSDHPVVVALRRTQPRQISSSNLVVIVQSPSEPANRRFAAALKVRLDEMVPSVFSEIEWKPDHEIDDFAERQKWLYAEKQDLSHAEELLDRLIANRSSPLAVDLEDDDPATELRKLRDKLDQKLPPKQSHDDFSATDPKDNVHYLGVMLWRRGDGLASLGAAETLEAVKQIVEKLAPQTFDPQMKLLYTGAIGRSIDEHNAVRDDLTLTTVVCTTAVLLVLFLYFRRAAVIWVIGAPAAAGVLLALGLAQLTVHALNLNTSFLVSIILGNGINAPIILIARYGEERRRGLDVGAALERAMDGAFLGTAVAMGAASVAYGSLLFTSFRGFSQFGLVGGSGMLLVWIWTFLLVPPMVIFGERLRPGLLTPPVNPVRRPFALLARFAERQPVAVALSTVMLLAVALVPLSRWLRSPLEWDLHHLASSDARWANAWSRMQWLGMGAVGAGHIGTDGVLLVDEPAQADPVANALIAQDRARGKDHVLKAVRTLSSVLPGEQTEKLQILDRIRHQIDRHLAQLSDEEKRDALRFRPPDGLRAIGVDDLPRRVRENFTEVDGTRGRLIGIDADTSNFSDWNGHDLLRLERSMRVDALGKTWVAAATSTVFAAMLEAMLRDGPRVTLAALVGVLLLIVLAFGPRGAAPVVGALLLGVVWLGGLLALIGMKLNFANFVGIPITLGIGADYAANIWARLRTDGAAKLVDVVADTGSAVALCSLTTIIGYSSLLVASNRALRSFGVVADLGEVTCLTAALLVLPSLVALVARARAR